MLNKINCRAQWLSFFARQTILFAFIYRRMIESKEKERMRKLQVLSYYSILFYKDFIKRLVSKEIVLLHRGQLYNPESAICTWNHGKSGIKSLITRINSSSHAGFSSVQEMYWLMSCYLLRLPGRCMMQSSKKQHVEPRNKCSWTYI